MQSALRPQSTAPTQLPASSRPRLTHLNDLPRARLIRPKDGPAQPVGLDERQLELGGHDLGDGLLRVDRAVQRHGAGVARAVGRGQVELQAGGRGEDDLGRGPVDLLEVERGVHGGTGLVKVVSEEG